MVLSDSDLYHMIVITTRKTIQTIQKQSTNKQFTMTKKSVYCSQAQRKTIMYNALHVIPIHS